MAPRRGVRPYVTAMAIIASLALALCAASVHAAEPTLGQVGKDAPIRPVALTRAADGSLTGTVNVGLRNESDQAVRLTVLFFADRGARPRRVGVGTAPLSLSAVPAKLAAKATTVLAVTAELGRRESPSDLEGALAVRARARGKVVGTTELRLTGALALPKDIAFEPPKVTLQVTTFWPFSKASGDKTTVRLRGPGVARLVDTVGRLAGLASAPPSSQTSQATTPPAAQNELAQAATLLLTNDNGDQALVGLSDLKQTAVDLAEITVSTQAACPDGATPCEQAAPKPGAYTGALALSPGGTAGPQLDVTVNSQQWLLIPLVLVLLGSIIGGLLPQLTQTAEMKERLRGQLRPLLDTYEKELSRPEVRGLVWDLDDVLGDRPWYEKRYQGLPGDPGVAALWADIHSARTMEELSPDVERVREFSGHLRRWMDVMPLAVRLAELHHNPPADRGDEHPWDDTNLRRSSERLLRSLPNRLPPECDQKAREVRADLQRQIELHQAFARAWIRFTLLDHMRVSNVDRTRDREWWLKADIDAFDARLPEFAKDDEDMSERLTRMADVSEAIERLLTCYDRHMAPEEVAVSMSRERRCAVIAQLESGERPHEEIAEKAGVSIEDVADINAAGTDELAPSPNGDADGHVGIEAGGGPGDGNVDTGQPVGAAATAVAPAPAAAMRKAPPISAPAEEQRNEAAHAPQFALRASLGKRAHRARELTTRAVAMTDWMLTIAIALATAVVYMIPFYKGTWGSWEDWLTAFAAGLAGQVAIKWAVLPALRSRRLPPGQKAS